MTTSLVGSVMKVRPRWLERIVCTDRLTATLVLWVHNAPRFNARRVLGMFISQDGCLCGTDLNMLINEVRL